MADANIEEASKAGFDKMNTKASTMLRIWQDNTARMMRANERAMHGMMSAAKLEMELGQELLACRFEAVKFTADGGSPADKMQSHLERNFRDMDRIMETMREASNKLREGFTEAATLMFEKVDEDARVRSFQVDAKDAAT